MPYQASRKYGRDDPDRLIRQLLNRYEHAIARRAAARDLSLLPPNSRILLALAEVLDDSDASVQRHARAGIAGSGSQGADLLAPFLSGHPKYAALALRALGYIQEARSFELLFSALDHPDTTIHTEAAISLGMLGDLRAVEPLCALLISGSKTPGKNDGRVRRLPVAAQVLARLQDPRAVETLCHCLDAVEPIAVAAADALGVLRNPWAVTALGAAATTASSHRVRFAAVVALTRIPDVRSTHCMCLVLADSSPEVRSLAVGFLMRHSDAGIADSLADSAGDVLVQHLERAIRINDPQAEIQAARVARLICSIVLLPVLRKRTRQLPLASPALAAELDRAITVIERRMSAVGNRPIPASSPASDPQALPIAASPPEHSTEWHPIPAAQPSEKESGARVYDEERWG